MIIDVAKQMLHGLEQVHQTKFLHRDVKPDNFRVQDGKVFITDFGTKWCYIDENTGGHISPDPKGSLTGTLNFMSIMTHKRHNQSRRDDLECFGYAILFLLTDYGKFSWMQL